MPKKIIIDTDPGVDDAMAILLAIQAPELELLGLTTIFGNVATPLATQNALRILDVAGKPNLAVYQGAMVPLVIPPSMPPDFVHGRDGLGNTNPPPPLTRPRSQPAAQFIVETVMAHPKEVTLIALAPLTNLALALLLEPDIAQNIADVVIMGGAIAVNGNLNPAAEANIFHDPHAADIVMKAAWPRTMIGLDVTDRVILSDADLTHFDKVGTRTGRFIYNISRFYRDYYFNTYNTLGIKLHDPAVIAYAIDPTMFSGEKGAVRVATEGLALGQTLMDRRPRWALPNPWTGIPETYVCFDVNRQRCINMCKERLLSLP